MQPNRSKILSILVMLQFVKATKEEDKKQASISADEVSKLIDAFNCRCFNEFKHAYSFASMREYIWEFVANIEAEFNKRTQEHTETKELINIQDEREWLKRDCDTILKEIYSSSVKKMEEFNLENEREKIVSDCVHLVDRVCDLLVEVHISSPVLPDIICGEGEDANEKSEEWESIKNNRDRFFTYYHEVTRAFCFDAPESFFEEKLEDLLDSIGYDMVDEFKQAYGIHDESQGICNGNEELKSLHTALLKLQACVNYLNRYNEYKKVLKVANMNQGETCVPANLLNDTLEAKMENAIAKMIKKAKLNEFTKTEYVHKITETSMCCMKHQTSINLDQIKGYFFKLLFDYSLHKELKRFKYLFNAFNVQGDTCEGIRATEDGNLIPISIRPLHSAFKDLSTMYSRFLIEVLSSDYERQLADAELVTITMQLKQVICKARKALFALKKIKETDADDNTKLYEKELFDGICNAVSIVYTLQKIGLDHSIYQDEFYKGTNTELQKYTEILETMKKKLIGGETLDLQLLNANRSLDVPAVAENLGKDQTNESDNDTAILHSMTESYKEMNGKLDELRIERIARLKTKDINVEDSGSKKHLESTLERIINDNVIDGEILEIEHGAVKLIKELKVVDPKKIDEDDKESNIVRENLVDLLNIIAQIELTDANIEKLNDQYSKMTLEAISRYGGINSPNQLISLAQAQFIVLDVTAQKILLRHKKVKLIAQFKESTEQKQDLEGHNSAEIGDGATKVFDVTQFLMLQLKKCQEGMNASKEPAVKSAIEHINNFTKKLEAKAKIDNQNSKCSSNTDLDEDIAIFTEDILDCFLIKNKYLLDEVKGQKIDKLQEWMQSHVNIIDEESNRIMNKIDISPENFAIKRITFHSIKSISLHEDLPNTPRSETNQQPVVENISEPTIVSLPKEQEVQNDSSSLTPVEEASNTDHNVKNPLEIASNGLSSQTSVAHDYTATHNQNLVADRTINAARTIDENANGPDATSLVNQNSANQTKSFLTKNADSEVNSNTGRLEGYLSDSIGQKGDGNDSGDEQNLISAKNTVTPNLGDSLTKSFRNSSITPKTENAKSKDKKTSTWGRKIAIAGIAVLIVILLFSFCYSVWHFFNANK